MAIIPRSVKLGIIAGMGLLIAFVGLTSVNIVVSNPNTLVGIGDTNSYVMYFCTIGLCFIGTLVYHQVPAGILIGIGVLSVLGWIIEGDYPTAIFGIPRLTLSPLQLLTTNISVDMLPSLMSFFFVLIFDLSGVIFGMSSLAGLTLLDGKVPGADAAFISAAGGTMLGASLGSTPIIVYVESAAGIIEGGKTGLTAVVAGSCFFLTMLFSPLISSIPSTATAPVLILVGAMMISQVKQIEWNDMMEAVPAFLTMIMMPFTFSINYGIFFGLGSSFCFYVFTFTLYSDGVIFYNRYFRGIEPIKQSDTDDSKESEITEIGFGRNTSFTGLVRKNSLSFENDSTTLVHIPSLIASPEDAQRVADETISTN
jgi:AGZA family xanthine/uracil permease-like MFS transporter